LLSRYDAAVQTGFPLYQKNKYRNATTSEVWKVLHQICREIRHCVFILDGFDECEATPQQPWNQVKEAFLEDLWRFAAGSSVRILISSRKEAEIFSKTRSNSWDQVTVFEYDITPQDTGNDIMEYSKAVVDDRLGANKDQGFVEEISQEAARKGNGMFLWVRLLGLQLDPGKNRTQLRQIVSRMPRGLEQTYQREIEIISNLDQEERARAMSILRWTLFAGRPLTVRELTEALLSEANSSSSYPYSELPDAWDEYYVNGQIRKLCRSLIDIQGNPTDSIETHTVHLMHSSVKEFLTQHMAPATDYRRGLSFTEPGREHEVLARTCLSYLCYNEVIPTNMSPSYELDGRFDPFQFIGYASRAWASHMTSSRNAASCSHSLEALIRQLLDPATHRWVIWLKLLQKRSAHSASDAGTEPPSPTGPLYVASLLGLDDTVQWLLSLDVDINASNKAYGSALQAAVSRGHTSTIQLLIKNGADIDRLGGKHDYAILTAVRQCPPEKSADVVSLLVQAGANIACCDEEGRSALHYSAANGQLDIAAFLLQSGAAVEALDKDGATPLFLAAAHGQAQLAELFVTSGAEINVVTKEGTTPVLIAARKSHRETLKLLLDRGASANCRAKSPACTPLYVTAIAGDHLAIQYLLDAGADTEMGDGSGMTPLLGAVARGHIEATRALILAGANVNTLMVPEEGCPFTPLCVAAGFGHLPIARLLIEHGALVNDPPTGGSTALQLAIEAKFEAVVQCLLESGASVTNLTHNRYTPLHIAAATGDIDIIGALLQHHADVNAVRMGASPLLVAVRKDQPLAVRYLLQHKATVEACDEDTIPPLLCAVISGFSDIVRILLEHGARPEAQFNADAPLLIYALQKGHADVIGILLERCPGIDEDPPVTLYYAIKIGHLEVVRILLAHETYGTLAKDPRYAEFAGIGGYDTIAQLLIQHAMEMDVVD
jgi:ankyrin repeat protein